MVTSQLILEGPMKLLCPPFDCLRSSPLVNQLSLVSANLVFESSVYSLLL